MEFWLGQGSSLEIKVEVGASNLWELACKRNTTINFVDGYTWNTAQTSIDLIKASLKLYPLPAT